MCGAGGARGTEDRQTQLVSLQLAAALATASWSGLLADLQHRGRPVHDPVAICVGGDRGRPIDCGLGSRPVASERSELARRERAARVERRDVRVVEGARLEIALTVCDGVLQISITVAKPTT